MDLLFKRYASPFLLLDETIKTGRFSEFVTELVSIVNEETEKEDEDTMWEYYLHRIFDKSFADFKKEMMRSEQPENPVDFETTLQTSYDILNGFVPD